MTLPAGKLQKEITELLRHMNAGAVLTYSSKAPGRYKLTFPDGTTKQLNRTAPRAAWDEGYIRSEKHTDGETICVMTSLGWCALRRVGESSAEVANL